MKKLVLLFPAVVLAAGCASDGEGSRVYYNEAWYLSQALPQGIPQGEPHETTFVRTSSGAPVRAGTPDDIRENSKEDKDVKAEPLPAVGAPADETVTIRSEPTPPATPVPPPVTPPPAVEVVPVEPTPPPVEPVTPPPVEPVPTTEVVPPPTNPPPP